jgi:hypothetical protein
MRKSCCAELIKIVGGGAPGSQPIKPTDKIESAFQDLPPRFQKSFTIDTPGRRFRD